jgi:hypothetical protein
MESPEAVALDHALVDQLAAAMHQEQPAVPHDRVVAALRAMSVPPRPVCPPPAPTSDDWMRRHRWCATGAQPRCLDGDAH